MKTSTHFFSALRKPKPAPYCFSRSSVLKNSLFLFFAGALNLSSNAQCSTFVNADAVNPLKNLLQSTAISSLDFTDIDGDGDLDCYIVPKTGAIELLQNVGSTTTPRFEKAKTTGFENVQTPEGSPVIQFADIDGDGDYDCFITQVNYSFRTITTVLFYRNTGTAKQPQFEGITSDNPVDFARSDYGYVKFYFADIDMDGDIDFYYNGLYNSQMMDYDQFTYLNEGTPQSANFVLYTNDHPHDFERQRTYYDWNRDGLPDYIKYETSLTKYAYMQNKGPLHAPEFVAAQNAPVFQNGMPFRIVDLNNDGAPEAFTAEGAYSTVAPVAAIGQTERKIAGRNILQLYSQIKSQGYKYQWEYNGRMLPATGIPFIYAVKPGTYVLHLISDCGTAVSLPYVVAKGDDNKVAAEFTSLQNIKVKVFPNPFASEVAIQLPAAVGAQSTIRVSDLAGRIMETVVANSSVVKVGRNLSVGTYLVEVVQNTKVIFTTKVIKQ